MSDLPDRSDQYTGPDGFIDVKRLITAYSFAEHAARADRYFESVRDPWDYVLRKPFHETDDAARTLNAFAATLRLAQVRAGHVVVDFGCGAGWLSMALALMNCEPIGVDISSAALALARAAAAEHPVLKDRALRFETLGDSKLPLPDASVDRIICFDSFHHVADQKAFLAEFHRVLVPGGIAAFSEPGPAHSRAHHSQVEMRDYAVIENDIVVEDIWEAARRLGFVDIKLALAPDEPVLLDLDHFNRGVSGKGAMRLRYQVGKAVMTQMAGKRMFALTKAGVTDASSRFADMLGGKIELVHSSFDAATRRLEASLVLTNTGGGTWAPSGAGRGAVNLGARLVGADGQIIADPPRHAVAAEETPPGGRRTVEAVFDLPAVEASAVELDLVAEGVGWFSDHGLTAVRIQL